MRLRDRIRWELYDFGFFRHDRGIGNRDTTGKHPITDTLEQIAQFLGTIGAMHTIVNFDLDPNNLHNRLPS